MPNQLTDLEILEGSLVDEPANKAARIFLFKRNIPSPEGTIALTGDTSSEKPAETPPLTPGSTGSPSSFRALLTALGKKFGWSSEDIQKVSDDIAGSPPPADIVTAPAPEPPSADTLAMTHLDAFAAFCESVTSLVNDPTADRAARLQDTLAEFNASVQHSFSPAVTEKAGRKISAGRLKHLKEMWKLLDTIVREQDPEFMPTAKSASQGDPMPTEDTPKAADVTPEKQDAPVAVTTEKADTTAAEEDVLKSLSPEVRAMIQKSRDEAAEATRVAKEAQDLAKAERNQREQVEYTDVAKRECTLLPGTVEKKGMLLWKLSKRVALTPEESDELITTLKSLNAKLKESELYKENGTTPTETENGTTALTTIQARAQKMVDEGVAKSLSIAIDMVTRADPALAERYSAESRRVARA